MMYVWSFPSNFLAVSQASSVDEARRSMLLEIGESGDGSCPERDKARERVKAINPQIWQGVNSEFCLTDSAECRELSLLIETQSKRIRVLEQELAEARKAMDVSIDSESTMGLMLS